MFSGERRGMRSRRGGPSQGLVAWRRFLVESTVLVVLIVLIVAIMLAVVRGFVSVVVAPCIVTLAFAIVAIARYER
jgi:hypothetical protein